ncbi:MAG: VWA domain-containing protein [Acidobacteria bacterium]|nr:VWA domain-containing protein [Acidobacteriota bacterium]MCW5947994.1 VWA domain-containing protein [Pyrinomonadaceae bacterium]
MHISPIKPILAAAVLLAFIPAAFAQSGRVQPTPTPTPPDEIVKVATEEIKLNVLAFNVSGAFVPDMTLDDLVIAENNVLHPPSSVRRIPANVLIVMDTGGEMRVAKSLDRTRRVAIAVAEALRDGDQVAVMQYSDRAEVISEWTTNRAETVAAIKRSNFGRRSVFVDAITAARQFMIASGADNRHIVLITDGTDSLGRSSAKFDALQALTATDISVHVLSYTSMEIDDIEPRSRGVSKSPPPKALPDEVAAQLPNGARDVATAPKAVTINTDRAFIRSMKARKADLEKSQEQLEKLAENTNGTFILPDSPDEMLLKAPLVARMIDSSYVVTYIPKIPVVDTRGIAERNIEVTSKRPGLIVQARRKVLIPTDAAGRRR